MKHEDPEKKIEAALAHVHPRRLDRHRLKSKRLVFRLHDAEFEEIQATAESLEMSIAEYFCTLHRYAVGRLNVSEQEAAWVHRTDRGPDTE